MDWKPQVKEDVSTFTEAGARARAVGWRSATPTKKVYLFLRTNKLLTGKQRPIAARIWE